jgi:hypothetical protein
MPALGRLVPGRVGNEYEQPYKINMKVEEQG